MKFTDEQISEVLEHAKSIYFDFWDMGLRTGLCHPIQDSFQELHDIQVSFWGIKYYIPVFTREFCGAELTADKSYFWWDTDEKEPRVKAFDKLIGYYDNSIRNKSIKRDTSSKISTLV